MLNFQQYSMIKKILKTVLVCSVLTNTFIANACTIFMANDGQNVWIGNNEDERQNTKYRMWFYPASTKNYGYTIWTDLNFGKLLKGFSYLNPQGGLNEFGLFLDYTAIDEIKILKDEKKERQEKTSGNRPFEKMQNSRRSIRILKQIQPGKT
jgi:penicillin V acylase-like amidase (Ntn superfamily)